MLCLLITLIVLILEKWSQPLGVCEPAGCRSIRQLTTAPSCGLLKVIMLIKVIGVRRPDRISAEHRLRHFGWLAAGREARSGQTASTKSHERILQVDVDLGGLTSAVSG
jgi:hypothetical protein